MMDYSDFYELATYLNETNKGCFSHREIAENAYIYKVDYDNFKTDSFVIMNLIKLLKENIESSSDGDEDAEYFLEMLTR